jgi:hypothetical protein
LPKIASEMSNKITPRETRAVVVASLMYPRTKNCNHTQLTTCGRNNNV